MKHYMIAGFLAASLVVAATPVRAQTCPIPQEFPITCGGPDGCKQTVIGYSCYGYWSGDTCGGPACGNPIACCGKGTGWRKIACSTLCAGCQKDGKGSTIAESALDETKPRTVAPKTSVSKEIKSTKLGQNKSAPEAQPESLPPSSAVASRAGGKR